MYIVIYDKITKNIYRIIEQDDKIISYGYSDNCDEVTLDKRPEGNTVTVL